jgi:hypothetical protein
LPLAIVCPSKMQRSDALVTWVTAVVYILLLLDPLDQRLHDLTLLWPCGMINSPRSAEGSHWYSKRTAQGS